MLYAIQKLSKPDCGMKNGTRGSQKFLPWLQSRSMTDFRPISGHKGWKVARFPLDPTKLETSGPYTMIVLGNLFQPLIFSNIPSSIYVFFPWLHPIQALVVQFQANRPRCRPLAKEATWHPVVGSVSVRIHHRFLACSWVCLKASWHNFWTWETDQKWYCVF